MEDQNPPQAGPNQGAPQAPVQLQPGGLPIFSSQASSEYESAMPPSYPQSPPSGTPPQAPPGNEPTVTPPSRPKIPRAFIFAGVAVVLLIIVFFAARTLIPLLSGPKEVELSWWGLWEDENIIAPIIAQYEAAHEGVKINYVKQSQRDYRDRLVSALNATEGGPDIFRFHNSWGGQLRGVLDIAPSKIFNTSDFAQTFYPTASSDLVGGSGVIGIPLEYDALTLFINEDIFTKAGKEIPTTWDELRTTALELTTKDERGVVTQSGVALGRTENVDHWPEILALMMLQNRASLVRPQGDLAEKALQFFTIFSKTDHVWDETLPPSTSAFAGGKLAMYFAPSWRAFEIAQASPNLKFRTVSLPQLPKDTSDEPNVTYATYWAEGVSANSKNKEVAWDFLKYMSQSESLDKLYKNASNIRSFGEPYPRVDMAGLLASHPILGSIVRLAPEAKSWYLASNTWDGPTGVNTQINKYYEDAINTVNAGGDIKDALATVEAGVAQVLAQLGQ